MFDPFENRLRDERDEPLDFQPNERIWRNVRRNLVEDQRRRFGLWHWWPLGGLLLIVVLIGIGQWSVRRPLAYFPLPQSSDAPPMAENAAGARLPASVSDGRVEQQGASPNSLRPSEKIDRMTEAAADRTSSVAHTTTTESKVGQATTYPSSIAADTAVALRPARLATEENAPILQATLPALAASRPADAGSEPIGHAPATDSLARVGSDRPVVQSAPTAAQANANQAAPDSAAGGIAVAPPGSLYIPAQSILGDSLPTAALSNWSVRLSIGLIVQKPRANFYVLQPVEEPFTQLPRTYFTPDGEPLHFMESLTVIEKRQLLPAICLDIGRRFQWGGRVGLEAAYLQTINYRERAAAPELEASEALLSILGSGSMLQLGGTFGYEKNWPGWSAYAGLGLGKVLFLQTNSRYQLTYPARGFDFPVQEIRRTRTGVVENYVSLQASVGYRLSPRWSVGLQARMNGTLSDLGIWIASLQTQYSLGR
jgi:hypothetical protein